MIEIYTDGSSSPNPGLGQAAAVITKNDKLIEEITFISDGITTNNVMELTGVIIAFLSKSITKSKNKEVTIYSDSNYVVQGINSWINNWVKCGWKTANKKPVKNIELWKELYELKNKYPKVKFVHVPGHSGNKWNDHADMLAKQR